MSQDEVVALMGSAKSSADWNTKCNQVQQACGGYPPFWFSAIIQSGLAARTTALWGGTDKITVSTLPKA